MPCRDRLGRSSYDGAALGVTGQGEDGLEVPLCLFGTTAPW
jgi:hypothetical protein